MTTNVCEDVAPGLRAQLPIVGVYLLASFESARRRSAMRRTLALPIIPLPSCIHSNGYSS